MQYSQISNSRLARRSTVLLAAVLFMAMLGLTLAPPSAPHTATVHLQRMVDTASSQLIFGALASNQESDLLCPTCDCAVPGSYATSQYIGRAAHAESLDRERVWSRPAEVARYLLHQVVLHSQINSIYYSDAASLAILRRFVTCPDQMLSARLGPLKYGLPTSYIYTRTGQSGRLARVGARPKYMQRHAESIQEYNELVKKVGYPDGTPGDSKQMLWLVIEDEDQLDQEILQVLQQSGLPYLYLAHGPTHRWGTAQWNMILKLVERLRDDFLGDGPVYNLDDDSYVLPELFRRLWRVKKAMAWQVGGFSIPRWNSTWEGPVFEDGKMARWHVGGAGDRVFPIDMNGFAINSAVVGTGRLIRGPKYIPSMSALGETEFLQQIYKKREEIEPLCDNTVKEKCYLVWHNGWMETEVDEKHPAMSPPDSE